MSTKLVNYVHKNYNQEIWYNRIRKRKNLSGRGKCPWGKCPSGKCPSEKCLVGEVSVGDVSVGKLSRHLTDFLFYVLFETSTFPDTNIEAVVRRCFSKQMFLKFGKVQRKTPALGSFYNTVASLRAFEVFSCKICDIFKNTVFTEHLLPTNTPHGFHVDTTWKWPFPRHFNVESTWCVCRAVIASQIQAYVRCYFLIPIRSMLYHAETSQLVCNAIVSICK